MRIKSNRRIWIHIYIWFFTFWRCFEQKKTRTDNQNVHKPNRILILVEREGNMKSLLQQMCWMMISHKKQTKKTPISNIKGSLFCTRMCGNPGRTKRIDVIREKCLFYRYTDWHRARRQRKKKGLQSYSERFDRPEILGQHQDALLQTWWPPADWATPPQSYSKNC